MIKARGEDRTCRAGEKIACTSPTLSYLHKQSKEESKIDEGQFAGPTGTRQVPIVVSH
jgi:hypothetical protein